MTFFRQYIAPLLVVLIFLVSLVAVSARIFLPEDLAQPAPTEEMMPQDKSAQTPPSKASSTVAQLPSGLSVLVNGLPEDPELPTQ